MAVGRSAVDAVNRPELPASCPATCPSKPAANSRATAIPINRRATAAAGVNDMRPTFRCIVRRQRSCISAAVANQLLVAAIFTTTNDSDDDVLKALHRSLSVVGILSSAQLSYSVANTRATTSRLETQLCGCACVGDQLTLGIRQRRQISDHSTTGCTRPSGFRQPGVKLLARQRSY